MKYDYLIIGQGIAGTTLALQLHKKGKSFLIIDEGHLNTSSGIAAGVMNPVTGRRFVKSWNFDLFHKAAKEFYQNWEQQFDKKIFKESLLVRALSNHEEHHDFLLKIENEQYKNYLLEDQNSFDGKNCFNEALTWIGIKAARVKIKAYLLVSRTKFESLGSFQSAAFEHGMLQQNEDLWNYEDDQFDRVVFCEGHRIMKNPFFSHLPFVPAKGESMTVCIEELPSDKIYKSKCMIVPFGRDNTFWIGSTYQWDYNDELPSTEKKQDLLTRLKASLAVPFEVKDHSAAIRPTGKDRRPYLGEHASMKGLYLFNGLGTKGTSLAPYWANSLIENMEDQKPLSKEVDIKRFA